MASTLPPVSPSPPRKRHADDIDGPDGASPSVEPVSTTASLLTPPVSYSNHSSPSKVPSAANRAVSPSLSSLTSISGDQLDGAPTTNAVPGAVPQKRRKLTPAEKLQQQQEKEAKAKDRAEAKAKREEEKRLEEEERQRKRAEREEKKRLKEFEDQQKRQQKDLAKQREEEEKAKKERSQMRLNAFFVKPKATLTSATASPAKQDDVQDHQSANATNAQGQIEPDPAPLPAASPAKSVLSDYERRFLPFSVPAGCVLAPNNHFRDTNRSTGATERIEQAAASTTSASGLRNELAAAVSVDCVISAQHFPQSDNVQTIVTRLQRSSTQVIDPASSSASEIAATPAEQLKYVPLKYIHFEQDVRPAYYGTYTKDISAYQARHLARNAWSRTLPGTDYGYDSEAEWEEPEEGEDILSDGEDDGDSLEGDDDMDGFLDDENDSPKKKRLAVTSELEPECTGLCWENDQKTLRDGEGLQLAVFHGLQMGVLLANLPATIDPFSTSYWEPDVRQTATAGSSTNKVADGAAMQPPPRVPLNPIPNGGNSKIMEDFTGKLASTQPSPVPMKRGPGRPPKADASGKPKRMVPTEQVDDFKRAVEGSDLTKLALVEDLKKRFPKLPKDAINNTLSTIAARVGAKEVEKRWVLL